MFGLIPCYFEIFNNLLSTPYFPSALSFVGCEASPASPHFSTRTQASPGQGLAAAFLLFSKLCVRCVSKRPGDGGGRAMPMHPKVARLARGT